MHALAIYGFSLTAAATQSQLHYFLTAPAHGRESADRARDGEVPGEWGGDITTRYHDIITLCALARDAPDSDCTVQWT